MKNKEIYITHMLALCHMYKEYDAFRIDLKEKLSKFYKGSDFVSILKRVSLGEYAFNSKIEKQFYNKHKLVIDTINTYTSIQTFINLNFDEYGRSEPESSIDYFYEYILKNEKSLEKILELLYALKALGFNKFSFGNINLGYYNVSKYNNKNQNVIYLENMEAIPIASKDEIMYKSNSSNYKIVVETENGKNKTKIILDNLIIDVNRLPKSVNKIDLLQQIRNLENSITKEKEVIWDAVIISDSVDCLSYIYEYVLEKINETHDEKFKIKLLEILKQIEIKINELKLLNNNHNTEITSEYRNININNINNGVDELRRNRRK